jgi:dTDP-glucose pyrophosphorylase
LTSPALVLLAAGMATRFGRLKQLEPVGPNGEAILDLNVADARAAGFDRIVMVIREELEPAFRAHAAQLPGDVAPVYVHQRIDDARGAPWGTGEAVLCARGAVPDRFAVANADDLYGPDAFRLLTAHLREGADWSLVGYPVAATLSDAGGVSRALCQLDDSGWLRGLREIYDVRADTSGAVGQNGGDAEVRLAADAPVSMNLWGFDGRVFPLLEAAFDRFRAQGGAGEFLLSDAVGALVADGRARVRVLRAGGGWAGITHPDDLPAVRAYVAARTASHPGG